MSAEAAEARVALPGGLWFDGVCHREAALRPPTGEDEAFLLETTARLLPSHRTTAILARCLTRLGPDDTVGPDRVRDLTIGDREALLLQLHRLALGEQMPCVLDCPAPSCTERLELSLSVGELLLPPYPNPTESHDVTIRDADTSYRVHFRAPTGRDQEVASEIALRDVTEARRELLRRCILNVVELETGSDVAVWPEALDAHAQMSTAIGEADPQAELGINLKCPGCGQGFQTILDAGTYVHERLASRFRDLYREVHLLAFYYHWRETEILGLATERRRAYARLLQDELAGWATR